MSDTAQQAKPYKESVWSKIIDRVDGAYDKFVRIMSAPSKESKDAWSQAISVTPASVEKKGVVTLNEPATVMTLKERGDQLWEQRKAQYAAMPRSEPLLAGEAHGEVRHDRTLSDKLGSRSAEAILADVSRNARTNGAADRVSASVYWSTMSEAGKQAQSTQTDLFQTAQRSPGLRM